MFDLDADGGALLTVGQQTPSMAQQIKTRLARVMPPVAAAGVIRLFNPSGAQAGPPQGANVQTSGGIVHLRFGSIRGQQAEINYWTGSSPVRTAGLAVGQTRVLLGVQVRVLRIWRMPDISNDAVDIRATPSS